MDPASSISGQLTLREVYECLASGTLPPKLQMWKKMDSAIFQLPPALQAHIIEVAAAKDQGRVQRRQAADRKYRAKHRQTIQKSAAPPQEEVNVDEDAPFRVCPGDGEYLELPTPAEAHTRVQRFLMATGNEALKRSVCVVCARELLSNAGRHLQ